MNQKEKEIVDKINLALKKLRDEINDLKYTGGEIEVEMKFGSARGPGQIHFINPPVEKIELKPVRKTALKPSTSKRKPGVSKKNLK